MFTVFVSFVLFDGIIYHVDNIVDFVVVVARAMIVCLFISIFFFFFFFLIVWLSAVVFFLLYNTVLVRSASTADQKDCAHTYIFAKKCHEMFQTVLTVQQKSSQENYVM